MEKHQLNFASYIERLLFYKFLVQYFFELKFFVTPVCMKYIFLCFLIFHNQVIFRI